MDQPQELRDFVDKLIEKYGLSQLLAAISEVCAEKAEHFAVDFHDTASAKDWMHDSDTIERVSHKLQSD